MPLFFSFGSVPSPPSGVLRDFFAFGRREGVGAGPTALQATLAAQLDSGSILGGVFGAIRCSVFDLAGQNIADQLGELNGIARALKALCCHRGSMPSVRARCERAEFQTGPLPPLDTAPA